MLYMSEEKKTRAMLREEREKKAHLLEAASRPLYPARTARTHSIHNVRENAVHLTEAGEQVTIAGRVMAMRGHGAVVFFDLFDGTARMQGVWKKDESDVEAMQLFMDTVDRGDFVESTGTVFTTQRGELSVLVQGWGMLAKAVLPLPTEHFGIQDEDERYRKRYLDILLNEDVRRRVLQRSVFWNSVRRFLLERDFVEVETPVLETVPGGADATPFVTHHNALDIGVHLRISAGELWQKRLMVAGLSKTFEIGRVFRNEGMSAEHAQDYTQLELYEAFSDFEKGKVLIRELYTHVAQETFGTTAFTHKGHTFDLAKEWGEVDFCQTLIDAYGIDPRECSEEEAIAALEKSGVAYKKEKAMNKARAVDLLWKAQRKAIAGPAFLVNVPVYLEPLAKRSEKDARVVERFQVLLAGSEVGKGFSELNDPRDQKARFLEQQALRDAGDDEAQFADMEYVEAMEYGMPPTFGFGVSERLFAFLAGVSIREAQTFPLMRRR
jgi:lysyl-tRNA synthetase, class II